MISQTRKKKKTAPSLPPRERLLNSAARLFYQEGVQAVGIERLLEDADTAKASLYSNFGSKDALVTAYLEREAAATKEKVEGRLSAQRGSAREKLLGMFDMLTQTCGDKDFRGCPFQNAAAEITDPAHPGRAVVERQRAWIRDLMRGLVVQAGLSPEPLTAALVVLYDGAIAGSLVDPTGASAKASRWAADHLLKEAERRALSRR
jgi:AcrR family transcriptional regulator